jgi:hypothetical protein
MCKATLPKETSLERNYKCPICRFLFYSQWCKHTIVDVMTYLERQHSHSGNSGTPPLICPICNGIWFGCPHNSSHYIPLIEKLYGVLARMERAITDAQNIIKSLE